MQVKHGLEHKFQKKNSDKSKKVTAINNIIYWRKGKRRKTALSSHLENQYNVPKEARTSTDPIMSTNLPA